jgi:DNA-binding IclR family transcriptional regulator
VAGNSADSGRSVTSKVIAILLTFTHGGIYSLTEIARLTGLPISTTHRLASELASWGILERAQDTQYRVGLPLRMIGNYASHAPEMHARARQVMEDLAAATRATVRLGVLEDCSVAFMEKPSGTRPVSIPANSSPAPAHATAMGKALLAFSSPRHVDQVIEAGLKRYTPFTLTTSERLRRSLAIIRLTHVAVARREYDVETSALAVPVFGAGGMVVAALEVDAREPQTDLRPLQPALIVAARSLTRELATSRVRGQLSVNSEIRLSSEVRLSAAAVESL